MMRNQGRSVLFASLLVAVGAMSSLGLRGPASGAEEPDAAAEPEVVPVETDMHEFMEYAFQEPYKRMHTGLSAEPADRAAWKVIKSDALLLAESGNLLLSRGPTENRAAWNLHSQQVRDRGAAVYAGGKARDYAATQTAWVQLIESCNACHQEFADGEHQLTP